MKPTIEVNESNFEREVLHSPRPVLVDFWAAWCGPCKMLAPVLNEMALEHQGQATIAKVDIDQNPQLASRFHVNSVPTLLYFAGGEVRDRTIGLTSKKVIAGKLAVLRSQQSKPEPA